jgi:N-acetyl-gamma-glutamyl-phosphate reductase
LRVCRTAPARTSSRAAGPPQDHRHVGRLPAARPQVYAQWYGGAHKALDLQSQAVYGLTEHYRDDIAKARLVACPGCYPTAVLIALLPLVKAGLVEVDDLIIDAKSGVSGAGRSLKQNMLFCEAGEGISPMPSPLTAMRRRSSRRCRAPRAAGDGQLHAASGADEPRRTVHDLCPAGARRHRRRLRGGPCPRLCHEPFVSLAPKGVLPATQFVRGSNNVMLSAHADRLPGRVIVLSALDNLVKGSAGQAIQNFNLMAGLSETTGLEQLALFP